MQSLNNQPVLKGRNVTWNWTNATNIFLLIKMHLHLPHVGSGTQQGPPDRSSVKEQQKINFHNCFYLWPVQMMELKWKNDKKLSTKTCWISIWYLMLLQCVQITTCVSTVYLSNDKRKDESLISSTCLNKVSLEKLPIRECLTVSYNCVRLQSWWNRFTDIFEWRWVKQSDQSYANLL